MVKRARARTQLFLDNTKYKIFRDLFESYKHQYSVNSSIKLTENAFANLQREKHVMNNVNWHNEMRNFCKIETEKLNKLIKRQIKT